MFPAETRLVPLCVRYLQLHLLNETPDQYLFPIDNNPALACVPKVDPGTIPITLRVTGGSCTDNFYTVPSVIDQAISPSFSGVLKALHWEFSLTQNGLKLIIYRAVALASTANNEAILTELERSPLVAEAIHRFRHRTLVRVLREQQAIVVEDDLSENSALASSQLARLEGCSEPAERSKRSSTREEMSLVSQEGEGYSFGRRPLPEPMVLDPPADIGRGVKNKENAEAFTRLRTLPGPLNTQDDLLSLYQSKKPIPEAPQPNLAKKELSREERVKQACDDIGIERFPEYALEFLRSYYKL